MFHSFPTDCFTSDVNYKSSTFEHCWNKMVMFSEAHSMTCHCPGANTHWIRCMSCYLCLGPHAGSRQPYKSHGRKKPLFLLPFEAYKDVYIYILHVHSIYKITYTNHERIIWCGVSIYYVIYSYIYIHVYMSIYIYICIIHNIYLQYVYYVYITYSAHCSMYCIVDVK